MSNFSRKPPATGTPFLVPTESSGAFQHYVSVAHQRGFAIYEDESGSASTALKGSPKREDLEAFVSIRPGSKDTTKSAKVALAKNFASNHTFDYKGVLALQADKEVISKEELKFAPLFEASRSEGGPVLDDQLAAELIVHYFRRLLTASDKVAAAAYEIWREEVAKLTTPALIEMKDALFAQVKGAYSARPCSVLKGYVILFLMWQTLVADKARGGVALPSVAVEGLLETEGKQTLKTFSSIFKMGFIRGLLETPLKEHPYVEALLLQFDLGLQLNPDKTAPFILTDNPLAYVDSSGDVFQLCAIDDLHRIDFILLPLSSSCLLKAVRKSIVQSPPLSVGEVNKMLAKVANTRYIAPVADYHEWQPEMGSAAFMPTAIKDAMDAMAADATSVATWGEDLNAMLKLVYAHSSETEKQALVAANLPDDVALIGAPTKWPQSVPEELGLDGSTFEFLIHFPKRANKVISSSIPWSLKENFQFFVHRNRLVDGSISVPTTDFTKEISAVRITYWNAGVVRIGGKVVRDAVHSAPGELEAKEGRLLLSFKAKVIDGPKGGHALIVVEGLTDTGGVRLRKYIWSVIL